MNACNKSPSPSLTGCAPEHRAIAYELYGESVTCERIQHGYTNAVYKCQTSEGIVILKVFHSPDSSTKIAALHKKLETVPRARILHMGINYLVMNCLIGEMASDQTLSREVTINIGRALRLVHNIRFQFKGLLDHAITVAKVWDPFSEHFLLWINTMLDGTAGMRLGRSLCDQIRSVIPPYLTFFDDAPSVLCHGDLDGSNIIIHNDGLLGFLDWEFAYSGPPFGDLGQLLRIGADWSSLAAGYFGEGETPSGWKEASLAYDILNLLYYLNETPGKTALLELADTRIRTNILELQCKGSVTE